MSWSTLGAQHKEPLALERGCVGWPWAKPLEPESSFVTLKSLGGDKAGDSGPVISAPWPQFLICEMGPLLSLFSGLWRGHMNGYRFMLDQCELSLGCRFCDHEWEGPSPLLVYSRCSLVSHWLLRL